MDTTNQELNTQDILERIDTLETSMREHKHNEIDSTSRLDDGKTVIQTVTDAATITPRSEDDCVDITAIAQAFTIANPAGTSANFDRIIFRIKDNGTGRAITWGSLYAAGGYALPTTTIAGKLLTLQFMYNTNATKWYLVAGAQEA